MANGSHLFKKGNQAAKGNGKPKTKARHRIDVAEILASENFCPFREAVRLYRLEKTGAYSKIEIVNSLQKYIAPTLKAVDLSTDTTAISVYLDTRPPSEQEKDTFNDDVREIDEKNREDGFVSYTENPAPAEEVNIKLPDYKKNSNEN